MFQQPVAAQPWADANQPLVRWQDLQVCSASLLNTIVFRICEALPTRDKPSALLHTGALTRAHVASQQATYAIRHTDTADRCTGTRPFKGQVGPCRENGSKQLWFTRCPHTKNGSTTHLHATAYNIPNRRMKKQADVSEDQEYSTYITAGCSCR